MSGDVYCDCQDVDSGECGEAYNVVQCSLSSITAGAVDVTETFTATPTTQDACSDDVFEADLDFVPVSRILY